MSRRERPCGDLPAWWVTVRAWLPWWLDPRAVAYELWAEWHLRWGLWRWNRMGAEQQSRAQGAHEVEAFLAALDRLDFDRRVMLRELAQEAMGEAFTPDGDRLLGEVWLAFRDLVIRSQRPTGDQR